MKKSLLCVSLLFVCLPPCAGQTRNSPTHLHSGPHRTALHVPVLKPKVLRPVATGGPFSDVPKDHWAAAAVETLRQRGIVQGYPAGTYRTKSAKN